MQDLKKGIQDSLLRLHRWRVDFNGEDVGYGLDPYAPTRQHHYAEAYCTFGQGYLSLHEATGEREFIDIAIRCGRWLIENTSPRYRNASWGLPWGWSTWDAPADLSYMITTALVGNFLMRLFEKSGDRVYLKTCVSTAAWMVEENGYIEMPEGILFYYANHPPLKFQVLNPSVVACSFLSRLGKITGMQRYAELSRRGLEYAVNKQHRDGHWDYSEKRPLVDNFHTALVLEALADHLTAWPNDEEVRRSLLKGVRFYRRKLFTKTGAGIEVILPRRKRWRPRVLFERYIRGTGYPVPARLWCYGAGLRALAKQSKEEESRASCIRIARYVIERMQLQSGAIRYKENDGSIFIRHEAHMFDGLAAVVVRMGCDG